MFLETDEKLFLNIENQPKAIDFHITMGAKVTKDIRCLPMLYLFIISLNFL